MPITVVGLGPGPAAWLTTAALDALRNPSARVFARTALHPALETALEGHTFESFDPQYEQHESLEAVHAAITRQLLDAAASGHVVLALPGSASIGEAILDQLRDAGAELTVIPGVSTAGAVLAAAGYTASAGVQEVDATSLGGSGMDLQVELNPRWPAVISGVFNRSVAGDVKLGLERVYPADWPITVVHHPGLVDQAVHPLPLAELDRGGVAFDHLTHLLLPPVPTDVPTGSAHGVRAIVSRLRAPDIGCPWDREQTPESLTRYVIEEAYEVVEAIREGTPADVSDELGDVLLQVALQAEVADQDGEFDWNDVMWALSRKLIRRHPHVFGDASAANAAEVVRNWDAIKAGERADQPRPESVLDKVGRHLPALKQAAELSRRAARAGFDWPERSGTLDKVTEELGELLRAETLSERQEELGDLLYTLAKLAQDDGLDPEETLRAANAKFTARFHLLEQISQQRGWPDLAGRSPAELLDAWLEAKRRHAAGTAGTAPT